MPGLYKHRTCVDQLETQQKTYNFKACDRYHTPTALVGYIDKVCTHNLIEWQLLCCLIVCNLLSSMQTEATLLANITPNIVECLHVVSICTPCCMLLGVIVQNKQVKRLSQQLPTFLLLRDRQSLAQQCWIRLHSSSNIVGATHMHHHTWSPKSYGLCPSHDTPHVPTLLAQQCLDLLHLSACSFRVKNITSLIFFQVLLKAMTFLSSVWNISFFTHVVFWKYYMCFSGKKSVGTEVLLLIFFSFHD